ncbi:MAG: ferrous iron transport protein A [Ruminococcus sp.]|nr:ferrous iron transport protein A [Ruminococcus sp.]
MSLNQISIGKEYIVKDINSNDAELNSFLLTLGCYRGAAVTVVSRRRSSCVVAIKDGRYNIDRHLASAISVY